MSDSPVKGQSKGQLRPVDSRYIRCGDQHVVKISSVCVVECAHRLRTTTNEKKQYMAHTTHSCTLSHAHAHANIIEN